MWELSEKRGIQKPDAVPRPRDVWSGLKGGEKEQGPLFKSASFPGVRSAKTKFSISFSTGSAPGNSPDSEDKMIPKECGCSQKPQGVLRSPLAFHCSPQLPAGGARVSKSMNFLFFHGFCSGESLSMASPSFL